VTDFEGKEVGYTWDALGHKERLSYPDGSEVKYEYNTSGMISKVLAGSEITSYTYDAMGRISERILPDSTVTKYEVNPLGKLENLIHSKDDNILDQFRYSYDPVGNITRIDKTRANMEADSGIFEYAYDSLGQLLSATHGEKIKRYRYDELGNRVKSWVGEKYSAGESTLHSYNAMNQLIRTQEGDAVKEYSYDGRGNLTKLTENGQLKASYTFDATNMMTAAFAVGKGRAEYTYNGLRSRVKRNDVRYILDMTRPYNNLLMTQGAQNQSFVWGNDLISAHGAENYSYLQDHTPEIFACTGRTSAVCAMSIHAVASLRIVA
jgi:YD repeat-containing protein